MQGWDLYNRTYDAASRRAGETAEAIGDIRRGNALRDAGQTYAGGDATGARNALLNNGMIDEALTLGRYDQQAQRLQSAAP